MEKVIKWGEYGKDGSYSHAVLVDIPKSIDIRYNTPLNDLRSTVSIDECLVKEIKYLWSKGIVTEGCCCGHGVIESSIIVTQESINKMLDINYVPYLDKQNCFYAKTKHKEKNLP